MAVSSPGVGATDVSARGMALLWLVSVALGAVHCWIGRHAMNPDGITYMDIADAYRAGDWHSALNSYRSPFYSWLLAPALALTHVRPDMEFAAVHAVNFLIFLAALFAFHFLLIAILRNSSQSPFPQWALIGACYAVFLWSSLSVITLDLVTPDLCVATAIYFTTGILLRIRHDDDRWAIFLILGLALGISYLIKAALLAFVPLMALLCGVAIGRVRPAIPRVLLVVVGFSVVAGPWVDALSSAKGRLTFGDAGSLAYGFMVEDVPMLHWHGGPPGSGAPLHPDRQIYTRPDTFEFATPISGTYPPSYDYSYWSQGMRIHVELRTHLRRLAKSAREYFTFFDQQLSGAIAILILLWCIGVRGVSPLRSLAQEWRLLVPVLYGFGLYAQVWVNWRYLGAYLTLGCIALLCAQRMPEFAQRRQVTGAAAVAFMAVFAFHIADDSYTAFRQPDPMLEHWRVVQALRELHVAPGSPVANIGDSNTAFWARLARVRIVAEIPFDVWDPALLKPDVSDVEIFWAASPQEKAAVMRKLAETGAKVAVATDVPPGSASAGWRRIEGTPYSVYPL